MERIRQYDGIMSQHGAKTRAAPTEAASRSVFKLAATEPGRRWKLKTHRQVLCSIPAPDTNFQPIAWIELPETLRDLLFRPHRNPI